MTARGQASLSSLRLAVGSVSSVPWNLVKVVHLLELSVLMCKREGVKWFRSYPLCRVTVRPDEMVT